MRPAERDILLLILAIASGSADGWSYFGLGHAFVANMTGNTVLCGLAVFTHLDLLNPLVALCFYFLGTIAATFLTRHVPEGSLWHRAVSLTLLLEFAVMAVADFCWALFQLHGSLHQPSAQNPLVHPLLALVAFGIGMQSGAMLRLRVPGIVTTYITGTWTTMASNLVKLRVREQHRPERDRIRFEERLAMQVGTLAFYFLSAVLTGWFLSRQPIAAGATPPIAVLCASVYGLIRG
jgi:uncharacterized membrane protein YoaK (UPF0700 family)